MNFKSSLIIDPGSLSVAQYDLLLNLSAGMDFPLIINRKEISDCLDAVTELNKDIKPVINCQGIVMLPDYNPEIEFLQALLKNDFEYVMVFKNTYSRAVRIWKNNH
jgi:hypothetical protein